MTKAEMMMLIMNGAAGVASGVANSKANSQAQAQNQQNQQNFTLQQLVNALQNQQQTGTSVYDRAVTGAQTQAAMSPLGQEQQFVQRQKLLQTLIPAMAGFTPAGPTDPGIAGAFRPPTNIMGALNSPGLMQSVSDQATGQSLADRRQMMAQVNPNFNFGSMDSFGVGTQYDQGVQQATTDARARQTAWEQAQQDLAQRQTDLTSQAYNATTEGQSTAAAPKKKSSIWGKIGSIAKVAVPIVLAATGVGIPAAVAITAGTNIAASKMQGKDWGDAIQSGVIGGATGAIGAGALGSVARGGLSAGTQKALAQGVLSAADTKMQGGTMSDALRSGVTSGVGSALASRYQGGSNGPKLNNAMGPESLPLGSGFSDVNNPGAGLAGVMANSPSLQLQSRPLASGMVPQGVQDNNASQMQKVIGGSRLAKAITTPSGANPTYGYPLKNAAPYSPRQTPIDTRSPMQRANEFFNPTAPSQRPPQLERGFPEETAAWEWINSFKEQPLTQQMQNPQVQMMMGAVGGMTPRAGTSQLALGAGPQPAGLLNAPQSGGQLGAGPQPRGLLGAGAQPKLLGPGSYEMPGQTNRVFNMGPVSTPGQPIPMGPAQYKLLADPGAVNGMTPPLRGASYADYQNAKSILDTLSSANGMTPEMKAQFLADPKAQEILRRVIMGGK